MKSVLITGTSKGIGLETALALSRAGHKVYATMRNPSRSPELAGTVEKEKLPVTISTMDVDSDSSVTQAIGQIYESGGNIDVLVNNAGIEYTGTVEEVPLSAFRALMETNYFGPLRCIKAVVPRMRKQRNGHIINVSSVAGRIAACPMAPYAAAKWALEGLSEALAQEMKAVNVRVSIVEPGIIATAMAKRIGDPASPSASSQARRWAGFFAAALKDPVPASVVAEKIVEIIESEIRTLRHPVGPSAIPFLQWRSAMSDEQWVDWGALEDDAWYRRVQEDFGFDARAQAVKA
ncbi:MAG TPA: SDR family oxidoreductase [Candidatus Acidoferrales bacterium]|nr:SDR family oxidoreductase [Candidatus Acidoferrales bacterium]